VLVPIQPAPRLPARPERVPIPPLPPRRQSKKISQRRDEVEKDYVEINKSQAAGQGRSDPPDLPRERRPQEASPFVQRERTNKTSEPSTQREMSSRTSEPASVPISNLLRGNSR
jgi:hypothetical protein